jgi:Cof subfamily protein (haloacid dehalogenase superfamily)
MLPLVMLDIDGTLLGSKSTISPALLDKVSEVRAKGMHLAVCTGRISAGLGLEIAAQLDTEIPHVFHNGAVLAHADGSLFAAETFPKKSALALIEHARSGGLLLELYSANQYFIERDSELSRMHAELLQLEPVIVSDLTEVLANEAIVRAQWTLYKDEFAKAQQLDLPEVQLYTARAGHRDDVIFASITKAGVSKGAATRMLAEHLGFNLKRVMGIGDSEGDTPYLDIVGHPRAVANGDDSIKAKYPVVPAADDDGVVTALEQALTL